MMTNSSTVSTKAMSNIEKAKAKMAASKPAVATPSGAKAQTNRSVTMLKTTLVVSTIAATLMGANLAARHDQMAVMTPAVTTAYAADATVDAPQPFAGVPNLPATTNLDQAELDSLLNKPLAPIPSLSIPSISIPSGTLQTPVTRSRSSR